MRVFVLIVGMAGAGKTTAAAAFSARYLHLDFSHDIITPEFVAWYNEGVFMDGLAKLPDVQFLRYRGTGPATAPEYDPTNRSIKERLRPHKEQHAQVARQEAGNDGIFAQLLVKRALASGLDRIVVSGARVEGDFRVFAERAAAGDRVVLVEVTASEANRRNRVGLCPEEKLLEDREGSTDWQLKQQLGALKKAAWLEYVTLPSDGSAAELAVAVRQLESDLENRS